MHLTAQGQQGEGTLRSGSLLEIQVTVTSLGIVLVDARKVDKPWVGCLGTFSAWRPELERDRSDTRPSYVPSSMPSGMR